MNIDGKCLNNFTFYGNLRPGSETISMNSVHDQHRYNIILGLKKFCVKYSNKKIMGHLNTNNPTCYKHPDNSVYIDLILTNSPNCFQSSSTFETGFSGFHKLILTFFRSEILQQRPNIISYQNYKRFDRHLSVTSKKI